MRQAFTLVEALVALFLVVAVLLPLVSVALSSLQLTSFVGEHNAAARLALSKLEELEAEDPLNLTLSPSEVFVGPYSVSWVTSDDASGVRIVRVSVTWSSITGLRSVEIERPACPFGEGLTP